MKPINAYLKINIITQVILIFLLLVFLLNESFAKTGFHANREGVGRCHKIAGYQNSKNVTALTDCKC
ncbi:hypothetical protein [Legionella micdadei]|uniref:Uncharacterized protein n=1 Tax=Legionella micdadei TaxID=451 RepID=A0A098GE43_LEGMI|nr:hypothetical protein [Legionella micdadei]ARG98096.1 hypothetical protein B6N58_10750 [Legionella micdadei]ARH00894.1 hypothetical protein B6V88_10980 [Legionella micdadei]KTD30067.1 hypothetical protein Lmic_0248 [Legionella micdadei]NSL18558.1 hypothetical protein [Legionella micdadei]CEG60262.1 exported protein of unknown function [Legionella micdadei]